MPPIENQEPADDLRSVLESAVDSASDDTGAPEGAGEATGAPTAGAEQPPGYVDPAQAPAAPAAASVQPGQPAPAETQQARAQAPAPAQVADNSPFAKAPGSWTPGARESWNQLPAEVKQEVWKREREATRALTMSTEARKWQDDFNRTMQPYLGFIAAENSTPMQAVNNMMQSAALLRVGTMEQKVAFAADVIKRYGIDLQALDSVLAGQQVRPDPQMQVQQLVQQQLAPITQMFQQQRAQEEYALQAQVDNDLDSFVNAANPDGTPKHEFFPDVQDLMADIVEVASRRGESVSLTAAYERAIMMHEPVRRVIEARKQRQSANRMTQVANQARGTAVSVVPSAEVEMSGGPAPGDSLRASIEAAFSQQQGR